MKKQTGFTLIEIMIAVVIVGILAAIAIPSYRTYILKAHRSDAEASLVQIAQLLERQYTANNSYVAGQVTTCPTDISNSITSLLPGNFASVSTYYTLTVKTCGASAFQLWAQPKSIISGSGLLTLDQTGLKTYNPGIDDTVGTSPWP